MASESYPKTDVPRAGRVWTRPSVAAAIVGVFVASVSPSIALFAFTFQFPPGMDLQSAELGAQLLAAAGVEAGGHEWVENVPPDQLRIAVRSRRPIALQALGGALLRQFNERLAAMGDALRAMPSQAQIILAEQRLVLRKRLDEAQQRLDAATTALPPGDPRVDREALRLRWNALRADWASTGGTAQQASADIERLRATPDITAGVVSLDDRRAAIVADPALQQDLKELNLRLTEMKLHLLNVWQVSAGRLEQLVKDAGAFQQTLADVDTSALSVGIKAGIERLRSQLDAYVVTLAVFQAAWTTEFTSVQRMEIDPQRPEILDIQERMRKLLNDFLFAGSRRLGELRTQLGESNRTPSANARHHVLESNLTRGFQSVQSAHHRFEFAAATIETPENFRLDASLRSAKGLHRRAREQIAVIEKHLEAQAAERARVQRREALAQAEKTVEELRAVTQRTVTDLFNVQDGLLSAGAMTEDFLLAALRVEVVAQSVQVMQRDLADLESRRSELESDRLTLAGNLHATLVSSEIISRDYQWGLRFRVGMAAGVLSFLVVVWIQRRNER